MPDDEGYWPQFPVAEAVAGHNNPPTTIADVPPEWWADRMLSAFAAMAIRRDELLASYARFHEQFPLDKPAQGMTPIGIERWNDDVQGRAGDLKAKIAVLLKEASLKHATEKAPVLAATRAIDGFFRQFTAEMEAAVVVINSRRTEYAKHLERRSRREAEERAALAKAAAEQEALRARKTLDPEAMQAAADARERAALAQQIADAPAADHTRVHGPLGSVSSLRTTWKFFEEESDLARLVAAIANGTAPLAYVQFNTTRINLAVRTEKVRAVPGCSIREEKTVR